MTNAQKIFDLLKKEYPQAQTALKFSNPWQILVATILSAQCTDDRVNIITKELFTKYPNISDYVGMKDEKLIKYIKSAGFYKNKSRSILASAEKIKKNFGGRVPKTMAGMTTLPGVARKTANVVLGNAYNVVEGIAVDTHVKRVTYRLGLTKETNPEKIEQDLMRLYSKDRWFTLTYILIEHGRAVCKAPAPVCSKCVLSKICHKKGVKKST